MTAQRLTRQMFYLTGEGDNAGLPAGILLDRRTGQVASLPPFDLKARRGLDYNPKACRVLGVILTSASASEARTTPSFSVSFSASTLNPNP